MIKIIYSNGENAEYFSVSQAKLGLEFYCVGDIVPVQATEIIEKNDYGIFIEKLLPIENGKVTF